MVEKVNRILYRIGIVLFLLGITGVMLYRLDVFTPTEMLYPCVFYKLSGLYCPGCGGTRSVEALLRGDLIDSFLFHPFVMYCFVMYTIFMVSHTLERIQRFLHKKKARQLRMAVKGLSFRITYVYIGIIIILLQWLLKNLTILFNIGLSQL